MVWFALSADVSAAILYRRPLVMNIAVWQRLAEFLNTIYSTEAALTFSSSSFFIDL